MTTLDAKSNHTLVASSGSDAVHVLPGRGKEELCKLDGDVWRLARQLRGEWRRERYACLQPAADAC
jgi:hypothetical protein